MVHEQAETGSILASMERDVQRLLRPVQPVPAFRERLRTVLMAAADTGPYQVRQRPKFRLRLWVLSASGVALAVFLAQYFLRLLRRSQ